jgi:undecaprenyl-diphosphatase
MTLLLVMLHTGTMFAVIVYFWRQWRDTYFKSVSAFKAFAGRVVVATALTAVVGELIIKIVEKTVLRDVPNAEIEDLFSHLEFIAPALAIAGLLILVSGLLERRTIKRAAGESTDLSIKHASVIGIVQGFCLPFRGLSRSGATISTGMLLGVAKQQAEAFSFALAVVITPPVVGREILRLLRSAHASGSAQTTSDAFLSLFGAVIAFCAGLLALKWLSQWLESGRWYLFGIYCLAASAVVTVLYRSGY